MKVWEALEVLSVADPDAIVEASLAGSDRPNISILGIEARQVGVSETYPAVVLELDLVDDETVPKEEG